MSKLWARIYLWWHNVCPVHLEKKNTYYNTYETTMRFRGKKCLKCVRLLEKQRLSKGSKKTQRMAAAIDALKPKEEQWQTLK